MNLPDVWKNKLSYPNELMKIITEDKVFFTYLTKMANHENQSSFKFNNTLTDFNLHKKASSFAEDKRSKIFNQSDINAINGIITNNKNNILIDDNNDDSINKSISKSFSRSPTRRKTVKQARHIYTEKEKRNILEHFRTVYNFKKPFSTDDINNNSCVKFDETLPKITKNTQNHYNDSLNITQRSLMFKSSIYSLLIPDKKSNNSISTLNNLSKITNTTKNISNDTMRSKSFGSKSRTANSNFGQFLNFDYEGFNKKIEIKNPEVKKVLEDINYYGPHFSHCPSCKNKNLEFYQTMEPNQCLTLLNFLKKKKNSNSNAIKISLNV